MDREYMLCKRTKISIAVALASGRHGEAATEQGPTYPKERQAVHAVREPRERRQNKRRDHMVRINAAV